MIKKLIQSAFGIFDLKLVNKSAWTDTPVSDEFHINIIKSVDRYTMTSPQRIFSLIEAVRYILANNVSGDFVE